MRSSPEGKAEEERGEAGGPERRINQSRAKTRKNLRSKNLWRGRQTEEKKPGCRGILKETREPRARQSIQKMTDSQIKTNELLD